MRNEDHINRALEYLREHGFPRATEDELRTIAARYPWLARRDNGWQQLARIYVEQPETREEN